MILLGIRDVKLQNMKPMKMLFFAFLSCILYFVVNPSIAHGKEYSPHLSGKVSTGSQGSREAGWTSGNKIVYDVYSGVDGKAKWKIVNRDYGKGKQPYLEFAGWSALVGYHDHNANNQVTYIQLVNEKNGKTFTYLAEQNSLDASKDLEYNRKSATGPIFNPCGKSTYNKSNEVCNMYYKNVGFVAHIPLNELFNEKTTNDAYVMKIIKKVENNVKWDYLKVPFDFDGLDFGLGKISLSSGLNSGKLIMMNDGVARRNYARETGYSGGKYFEKGRSYQRKTQNEKNTVVWYGVKSPHDGGQTKWASSAYWKFGGENAELSYQVNQKKCPDGSTVNVNQTCSINITIKHIDANTNQVLRTDNEKLKVGSSYSYSAEAKGTFKDQNKNPYVASPLNQKFEGRAPEKNLSFVFKYKASLPDPSVIKELEGSTPGMAKGYFLWELRRVDPDQPSKVYTENQFEIVGKHYAVRNINNEVMSTGVFNEKSDKPMALLLDSESVKGKNVHFNYSYEYTNHYKLNYSCSDQQGSDCFEWTYKDTTPVWENSYKKIFNAKQVFGDKMSLLVNPSYGKTFEVSGAKQLEKISGNEDLIVGKKKEINMDKTKNELTFDKTYYEKFQQSRVSESDDYTSLKTQSWINISPGSIEYSVELPSDAHKKSSFNFNRRNGSNGYYYAVDVDKSLQSIYRNETPYAYSNYAFPLQWEKLTDQGLRGNERVYDLTFASDYFFVGKYTGIVQTIPYTQYLQQSQIKGTSIPSSSQINKKLLSEANQYYQKQTGEPFGDSFLKTTVKESDGLYGSRKALQRYYIPIESDSPLKSKRIYENMILLQKMGLNDVTLLFGQRFEYDRYLMGSVVDDAYVIEQRDSIIPIEKYPHSVTVTADDQKKLNQVTKGRSTDLLFGIRETDHASIFEKLQKIIKFGK